MPKHFLNLEYPFSKSWDKNKDFLSLEIKDVECSITNGLRRIMKGEIPTVGFRIYPYEDSTLNIIKNDTPLDNEMLSQRIGLIPIHVDVKRFDPKDYLFILEKENESTKDFLEVTSQDFQVKKLSENKFLTREQVKKIFPPNPYTGEYILITLLKPWENMIQDKPRIYIEGRAVVSIKKEHALFSQTSAISCSHKVDPELAEVEFQKYLEEKQKTDLKEDQILAQFDPEYQAPNRDYSPEKNRREFETLLKKRCYYQDDNYDPYWFQMTIESVGIMAPILILDQAIEILVNKIIKLQVNLENEREDVIVKKGTLKMDNAYRLIIKDEDHTLGNLLQTHFYKYFVEEKDVLDHISYESPHPLYKRIDLILLPKKNYSSFQEFYQNIIKDGCNRLLETLKELRVELHGLAEYKDAGGKTKSEPKSKQ